MPASATTSTKRMVAGPIPGRADLWGDGQDGGIQNTTEKFYQQLARTELFFTNASVMSNEN